MGLAGDESVGTNDTYDDYDGGIGTMYAEVIFGDVTLHAFLARTLALYEKYGDNPRGLVKNSSDLRKYQAAVSVAKKIAPRYYDRQKQLAESSKGKFRLVDYRGMSTLEYLVFIFGAYLPFGKGLGYLQVFAKFLIPLLPKAITWIGASVAIDKLIKLFHGDAKADFEAAKPYLGFVEELVDLGIDPNEAMNRADQLYKTIAASKQQEKGGFFSNISTTFKVVGWTALAAGLAYGGYKLYQNSKKG